MWPLHDILLRNLLASKGIYRNSLLSFIPCLIVPLVKWFALYRVYILPVCTGCHIYTLICIGKDFKQSLNSFSAISDASNWLKEHYLQWVYLYIHKKKFFYQTSCLPYHSKLPVHGKVGFAETQNHSILKTCLQLFFQLTFKWNHWKWL